MEDRVDQFPIVGIGASAGGLEALQELFDNMPSNPGMAFVIVQHLSPDFKSMMVELLSKHTEMEVRTAEDDMPVGINSIYLIPIRKNITIKNRRLRLQDKDKTEVLNLPTDIFFNSLGNDIEDKAIGVILSGTGTDGSRGIKMIKEEGGVIMAQDPDSAKFDGMPRSAIATGLVDTIMTPAQMAVELVSYAKNRQLRKIDEIDEFSSADSIYFRILKLVRTLTEIDFTAYKRQTISRRMEKFLSVNNFSNLKDFHDHLVDNPDMVRSLCKEFLIGVTSFFRDKLAFASVRKNIIGNLIENGQFSDELRIWVAGCSTGEEAYSMAIMLDEYITEKKLKVNYKIFATDIDKEAIETASLGTYYKHSISELPEERIKQYFTQSGNQYLIRKEIREKMVFAQHNLIKDPPFIRMDLISCRNMLIYIDSQIQKKILLNFQFALKPRGYLFLGPSESLGEFDDNFEVIDSKWKLYRAQTQGIKVTPLIGTGGSDSKYIPQYSRHGGVPTRSRVAGVEKFESILVNALAPSCILIDETCEVQYLTGNMDSYLTNLLKRKRISTNLLDMVDETIAVAVRNAVRRLISKKEPLIYKNLVLHQQDGVQHIDLKVARVDDREQKFFIVEFLEKEQSDDQPVEIENFLGQDVVKERIENLEAELLTTKRELQITIEELETTNEELQASNEELLASNEEMQSTNEELQSVNEELYTVNTELQNKNQELLDVNNDINNLLESTDLGTIFLDERLNIRKFTPPVREHFNIMETDIGRPINHFTNNLHYDNIIEDARNVLDHLKTLEREIQSDGDRHFLMRLTPFQTDKRKIEGVVITFVDITIQKQAEQDVKRLNETLEKKVHERTLELEVSNSELEAFNYSVSHDLRAPLRAIINFLTLIKEGYADKLDDKGNEFLDLVLLSAGKMGTLVDDLLAFSRLGKVEISKKQVDVIALVNEEFRRIKAPDGKLEVELKMDKCPRAKADYGMLAQVVSNLLNNAIKYSKKKGKVVIEVGGSTKGKANEYYIKDNGIGFDKKYAEKIFGVFERLHGNEYEGTGVGLAIVKRLILKHGGEVWAKSQLGKGTTFYFTLPN
ncbi:MAG: CheR family methyltransferase [Bacteroidota bacterium]